MLSGVQAAARGVGVHGMGLLLSTALDAPYALNQRVLREPRPLARPT